MPFAFSLTITKESSIVIIEQFVKEFRSSIYSLVQNSKNGINKKFS